MANLVSNFSLIVFHTIKFFISFILLMVLFSPIYLYRWCLKKLHLILYPENIGIVSPLSAIYFEPNGTIHSKFNLVLNLKFQGQITREEFAERILTKIIYAKDANGQLIYPELQQVLKLWCGYVFWTKPCEEAKFDINRHVISLEQLVQGNPKVYENFSSYIERNEEFCQDFIKLYVQQDLKSGQSPWEILVMNNIVREDTNKNLNLSDTLIIFKYHHCMADGHSIFSTTIRCADSEKPRYEPPRPSKFEQNLAKLMYPFLAPVHMGMARVQEVPSTPWDKVPAVGSGLGVEKRCFGKTKLMSMLEMKKISKVYKVPFSAVLMGVLGNSIRNFLIKNNKEIPAFILCGIPLPTPAHPEGLGNDWYFTFIKIPLQGISQLDLINKVATQFLQIKRSTLHVTRQHLHKLIFMLPIGWAWKKECYKYFELISNKSSTPWPTLLSSMPGPKETVEVHGKPLVEVNYAYNRAHGNSCLMTMLSYKDDFQLWLSIDERITFGSGVDSLISQINKEFENVDVELVNNLLET